MANSFVCRYGVGIYGLAALVLAVGCSTEDGRTPSEAPSEVRRTSGRTFDESPFTPSADGFVAEGARHYARVTRDGALSFGAAGAGGVIVNTARIVRGGIDVGAGAFDVRQVDGEIVTSRGAVDEVIANHASGVDQLWKFARAPNGSGDLRVEVALAGATFEAFGPEGLRLRDAKGKSVVYGRATWVDAKGTRTPVETQWDGTHAVILVPQTVIGNSVFPAELDTSVTTLSAGGCTTLSLGASPASPQAAGTTVAITGNATCTAGSAAPEYQFYYLAPGGYWALGQAYSSNATFNWDTTGKPGGTYTIQVRARQQGSALAYESIQSFSYTLTSGTGTCSTLSTGATPASPQTAGTPVALSGTATCTNGATPEYQFLYLPPGGSWTLGQAYGPSATFNWDTTNATSGTYAIQVRTRAQGSTSAFEAMQSFSYSITGGTGTCGTLTASASPASPQAAGTAVALDASATCSSGATPEYQFLMLPPSGYWTLAQAYGPSSTFNWDTTAAASGTYTIQVRTRAQGSSAPYQAVQSFSYSITGTNGTCNSMTLSASPASPQNVGTTIAIDALASCTNGATPVYQFYYLPPGGYWTLGQAYSPSATFNFDTSGKPTGTYSIQVRARASTSSAAYESVSSTSYQLQAAGTGVPSNSTSTLGFSPTSVPADGTSASTFTITVKDVYGNPVAGQSVTFSSSDATDTFSVGSGNTDGNGQLATDVHATNAGDHVITATAGAMSLEGTVTFTSVAPACTGLFGTAVSSSAGTNPFRLAAADFNGDGKRDVVVLNYASGDGGTVYTASVLLGNNDGTFQTPSPLATAATSFADVATADFDKDGKSDVVIAGLSTATVLLGNGDGTFQPAADYVATNNPYALFVTDENNDGNLDVVTVNGSGWVSVMRGDGAGAFTANAPFTPTPSAAWTTAADFNDDGKVDLLSTNQSMPGPLVSYFGLANGTFQNGVEAANTSASAWLMRSADFNNDGLPDVLSASTGAFDVWFNQLNEPAEFGGGAGQFWGAWNGSLSAAPRDAAGLDIDGDGVKDVVLVLDDGTVSVSRGVIGSYFYEHAFYPATTYNVGTAPERMASGAFNGDAHVDLAVVNTGSNTVSVLLNSGCVP